METLLDLDCEDPEENAILSRIKNLAANHLPKGWRSWKIIVHSKEELLGTEMDPRVLNKIRFALPTVGLARAFVPDCSSLPE